MLSCVWLLGYSIGYSPPDSSVYGSFQIRISERVAISFLESEDLPDLGPNPLCISYFGRGWPVPPGKPLNFRDTKWSSKSKVSIRKQGMLDPLSHKFGQWINIGYRVVGLERVLKAPVCRMVRWLSVLMHLHLLLLPTSPSYNQGITGAEENIPAWFREVSAQYARISPKWGCLQAYTLPDGYPTSVARKVYSQWSEFQDAHAVHFA